MNALKIGSACMTLDSKGTISSITADNKSGESLLPLDLDNLPLIKAGLNGKLFEPVESSFSEAEKVIQFAFSCGTRVSLSYEEKKTHTVFTVTELIGEADCLIAEIAANCTDVIGDVIGVVQGSKYSVGIQGLNIKTLAGFPLEFADEILPQINTEQAVSELSVDTFSYFESAAFPMIDLKGSLLQLYCENRERTRTKNMVGFKDVSAGPMKPDGTGDEKIEGMSFAVFCCLRKDTLDCIGEIELAEGLPHPMLDGEWAKKSRSAMQSYLIAEFNNNNLDKLLDYAEKGGFKYLYHPEPFENWGHFKLRSADFPEGDTSLKDYAKRAEQRNMALGLHTLTSFTTTNDPYVTPLPNDLAVLEESKILESISDSQNTIALTKGDEVKFMRITSLQTIRIDDELITYEKVSSNQLVGCTRGAFGTTPSSHNCNSVISLLCDYPYKVFFPQLPLQDSYSLRLAELFKNGASQISFDGLEGCACTGEDSYAINRFCMRCWENWGKLGNDDIINDASRLNHNLWHMNTRMNWGEPWGAKMREGMLELRMRNQDFYQRNLFPRMLGWFLIRKADRKFEATTLQDIEWALSMAAGFDAGFAFVASEAVLDSLGNADEILNTVKLWEKLRIANAFSDEQREELRNPKNEYHLEEKSGKILLYPMDISQVFVCDLLEMQPGQPGGADWSLNSPFESQPLKFTMKVDGNGNIVNPSFANAGGRIKFTGTIKGGQYLIFDGEKAYITDRNYCKLEDISFVGELTVEKGQRAFSYYCDFNGEEGPEVTVRVITYGNPQEIKI